MRIDNRRHSRARIRWPVGVQTPAGLIDGKTENVSLGGAFIRQSMQLESGIYLHMVIGTKGHFIPYTAQIVWSDERSVYEQDKSPGIGVGFTRMMLHDRKYLYDAISSRL